MLCAATVIMLHHLNFMCCSENKSYTTLCSSVCSIHYFNSRIQVTNLARLCSYTDKVLNILKLKKNDISSAPFLVYNFYVT